MSHVRMQAQDSGKSPIWTAEGVLKKNLLKKAATTANQPDIASL